MENLNALRETLPEAARDVKINLQTVLQPGALSEAQLWGVAVASAYASRNQALTKAVLADAKAANVAEGTLEDARASAVIMGMNNVLYRFRHIVGKETYSERPARVRMGRLVQVTSNKPDLELFSLAVSAINNCESCIKAHEVSAMEGGITEEQIFDAIRVASVIHSAAIALETL